MVEALDDGTLFDDSADDHFQREPFVARFKVGRWDFTMVEVHTRPEAAVAEIGALHDVVEWARAEYGDDDVITVGDFNASCNYASTEQLDALTLRSDAYLWIVPDGAHTNVASTPCAYDRIVTTGSASTRFVKEWAIDEDTGEVSDHRPVWAQFR